MMSKKSEPTVAVFLDAVLKRMGPLNGCADGAVALLDAYIAKLEAHWQWCEAYRVQCQAEEAIREAVAKLPRPASA